jgi:hypothetical protein
MNRMLMMLFGLGFIGSVLGLIGTVLAIWWQVERDAGRTPCCVDVGPVKYSPDRGRKEGRLALASEATWSTTAGVSPECPDGHVLVLLGGPVLVLLESVTTRDHVRCVQAGQLAEPIWK